MSQAPLLRPGVLAAKQQLAEGREKLAARHHKGSPGIQVCRAMTDLLDSIVLGLYQRALEDLDEHHADGLAQHVALVAHGGLGRRDVAPYSDVDLMILHAPEAEQRVARLAQRMLRDVFDVGLSLGQSVRTPRQACQLASKDATIATSLIESRWLAGSETLFQRFWRRFQVTARRRGASWIAAIVEARDQERAQYGETVYLLEPNIKRSRGALRDVQLLRWVGFVRYGVADPDGLRLRGELHRDDFEALQLALEFLLRLRNELHFQARKSNDVLDRAEQLRIAREFGYQGAAGMLPVEAFMRDYFLHTTRASGVVTRFVAGARRPPRWFDLLTPLLSHQFEGDFQVGPNQISANRRGLAKVTADLSQILRLCDLANLYDKPISHATSEAIRAAVPDLPDEISADASRRFLNLLQQPARLSELLRSLHDMGVLEKLVPAFTHARNLLQFNEYHKFTVDEHSLRAVEAATSFQSDPGPLGAAYRGLKRKWMLHLALLLHDLGKGFAEDHSEVGLRIADETAERLGLSDVDGELLKFLVHKHLMMSHLAFRRDTSDEQLITRFAVDVGSTEALQMLYLLTAADLAAVGPGVLNAWKVEVLSDLYFRALERLGGASTSAAPSARLAEHRAAVLSCLGDEEDLGWFEKHLDALHDAYLAATPAEQIAEELRQLRRMPLGQVDARGRYLADSGAVEFCVATHEQVAEGIFHKLTGALGSQGLEILSAEINTLYDGMVLDRFCVIDPDFEGPPPDDRLAAVCRALVAVLQAAPPAPPTFRRIWRAGGKRRDASLTPLPPQVRVDNGTSDAYTILDIFAADRTGLLYAITRALFELGLSVGFAKIGTYLDQVVDVFYVTDAQGRKIEDPEQLRHIRNQLLERIDAVEREEATQGYRW